MDDDDDDDDLPIIHSLPSSKRKSSSSSSSSSDSDTFDLPPNHRIPTTTRCTRSRAAPDWTPHELLILINEIAALDGEHWLKALSSYQKWKMITDNCSAFFPNPRSLTQCKRRWESLISDYKKIRSWDSRYNNKYWSLTDDVKRKHRLPLGFDQEVFGSMDAVIKAQENREGGSDSEELYGLHGDDDANNSGEEDNADSVVKGNHNAVDAGDDTGSQETGNVSYVTFKVSEKTQEMTAMLQEHANRIHAVLRGELPDNASRGGRGLVDLAKPNAIETEFIRRQADELIKAFGVLGGTLDQFKKLIQNDKCKGIRHMNSMAS